jgi:hypothetical protein
MVFAAVDLSAQKSTKVSTPNEGTDYKGSDAELKKMKENLKDQEDARYKDPGKGSKTYDQNEANQNKSKDKKTNVPTGEHYDGKTDAERKQIKEGLQRMEDARYKDPGKGSKANDAAANAKKK